MPEGGVNIPLIYFVSVTQFEKRQMINICSLPLMPQKRLKKSRKSKDRPYNGETGTKKTHKVVKALHTILKIEQLGGELMRKGGKQFQN